MVKPATKDVRDDGAFEDVEFSATNDAGLLPPDDPFDLDELEVVQGRIVAPGGPMLVVEGRALDVGEKAHRPDVSHGVASESWLHHDLGAPSDWAPAPAPLAGPHANFTALFAESPAVLWTGDRSGRRYSLSAHWARLTGQSLEDAVGFGFLDRIHVDDRKHILAATHALFDYDQPYEVEYRVQVSGDIWRWHLERARLVDRDGSTFVCGVVFDISERPRWDDAPARSISMQERMISVVSHDLRSPLTTMRTVIDTLRAFIDFSDERVARLFLHLDQSSRRAERMVSSLMGFARERADGHFPITLVEEDVSRLLRDLVDEAAECWHGSKVLSLSLPKGSVRALIDSERLTQALSNLIANAVEHGEGPDIEVTLLTSPEIRVRSSGPPIPRTALRTLFEPFHARRGRGLGLGLWIARQIAEAHGGTLTYRHDDGWNIFSLSLPHPFDP